MADVSLKDEQAGFYSQCERITSGARPQMANTTLASLQRLYANCKSGNGEPLFTDACLSALRPVVYLEFSDKGTRRVIFSAIKSIASATGVAIPNDYFSEIVDRMPSDIKENLSEGSVDDRTPPRPKPIPLTPLRTRELRKY